MRRFLRRHPLAVIQSSPLRSSPHPSAVARTLDHTVPGHGASNALTCVAQLHLQPIAQVHASAVRDTQCGCTFDRARVRVRSRAPRRPMLQARARRVQQSARRFSHSSTRYDACAVHRRRRTAEIPPSAAKSIPLAAAHSRRRASSSNTYQTSRSTLLVRGSVEFSRLIDLFQ